MMAITALLSVVVLAGEKDPLVTQSVIPTNNLPKVLMFGDSICGGFTVDIGRKCCMVALAMIRNVSSQTGK